ncbi:MAG: histidine phosphatase family protein [Longimicrobiales bacterium]
MKTLYLLRHAKSSWEHDGLSDYDRPLAPRGLKAAPRMGRFMAREELIPHRTLCSGALRARETWELVAPALGEAVPTEFRPEIYHSSPSSLLELIHGLGKTDESALLVGHNPTFQQLSLSLAGSGDEGALRTIRAKFPTGALAVLDFPYHHWPEVAPGAGYLRMFVPPRSLK